MNARSAVVTRSAALGLALLVAAVAIILAAPAAGAAQRSTDASTAARAVAAGQLPNATLLTKVRVVTADITVSPTTLTFPDTGVGTTSTMSVTVANHGSASVTPNYAGGAPNDPTNFGGSQNCAGVTLDPGASCTFTYTFSPTSTGTKTSETTIGIDSDNYQLHFTGNAVPAVSVAPTTLTFPDTAVGSTSHMLVTVTNVVSQPVTPNYAGGAPNDPTNFGGSQNCAGVALDPGHSCTFDYTFTPTALGPWSTNTTIDVDDVSYPITMAGKGVATTSTTTTASSTSTSTSTSSPTTHSTHHATTPAKTNAAQPTATAATDSATSNASASDLPTSAASSTATSGVTATAVTALAAVTSDSSSIWPYVWTALGVLAVVGVMLGAYALGRRRS